MYLTFSPYSWFIFFAALKVFLLVICLQTVDARGPREPWHDLHSRIDGPAAYDVLQNFEERWLKASKRHGIKKLAKSNDDALLRIERIPDIININDAIYFSDNDPETWHVQVLDSFTDTGSVFLLCLTHTFNSLTFKFRFFVLLIQTLPRGFQRIHEKQPGR